jgi:hypothetical protein
MAGQRNADPVAHFFAKVAEALGEVSNHAVADIRHKVVEEGWFGREVTPERTGSMAERLGWSRPDDRQSGMSAGQQKGMPWDGLPDRLAKEYGHRPEPSREHDQELDR